ncbi:MAG: 16S rRNA (guanine(527)-N(7))-methyltransferase RsmG [Parasporobacterium sp.]|nr:16S rRNA (guanine(527)-N(7))-methyltransferase RsmG [Parasporobacterium sp.]
MFHVKQFLKLAEFCKNNNIAYDAEKDRQFNIFCDLLEEKNRVMNLTGVTDHDEAEIIHFIDSVEAAAVINELYGKDTNIKVLDIGTGAGFPGIPLKIVMPHAEFVLADALNKRINFINEVISAANLENITAIQGRAEEIGQSGMRESFDICVSRAVADTSVLLEYVLPTVKKGGLCILYKSGDYRKELETAAYALDVLGGTLEDVKEFCLPESDIGRSLVIIRKINDTPLKYPRRPGKPSKSPLIMK